MNEFIGVSVTEQIFDIRGYRKTLGMTRAELAMLLGVNPSSIYRWEGGITKPSQLAIDKIRQIASGETPEPISASTSTPKLRALAASGLNPGEIAKSLIEASKIKIEGLAPDREFVVTPAPWVRNGPPDQNAFHEKLIRMQFVSASSVDLDCLIRKLSLVESVNDSNKAYQYLLEAPKADAMAWNSNYGSHGWHRYVGRFPPHLVRALLNYFGANENTVVCDPFSGSGTTAVECRLLGIPFVGVEICPLSYLMSKTKSCFPVEGIDLVRTASMFEEFFIKKSSEFMKNKVAFSHDEVLKRSGNPIPIFTNIQKWFTAEALLGVSIAVEFGMSLHGFEKDAFLLAISAKMRSIGNVDVDVVRAEYSKKPRLNVDIVNLISKQLRKMAKDIHAMIKTHNGVIGAGGNIKMLEGSVLDINISDASIDFVVTSPPYGVEAISYLRTHLLSYRALQAEFEHDPYDTRDKTIGSEYAKKEEIRHSEELCEISPTFNNFFSLLEVPKELLERKYAMMKFFEDLHEVGQRMERWLKPAGGVAFVIGNKRIGSAIIPADKIISEIYKSIGLNLIDSIQHKLKTNNSNSHVPWQDRVIDEEYVLIFRKVGV